MDKSKKSIKKFPNTKNDKKAQINNEIIQLQGKFKQAKIVTIRKIVNKLKQPEKNSKQNRVGKLERYQNVLNQLKTMSPKRLGVLALLYYKTGKNYLADQNSTVEQLAVGYFCEHKAVGVTLDAIRNKLKLAESSEWRKLVKKLFKKKEKSENVEKMEKKTSFIESDATDTSAIEKSKNKKAKQNVETKGKQEKSTKLQKKRKESAAQPDEPSESDAETEVKTNEMNASEAPTTVDDFFITADGKNYLSNAVVTRKQEEDTVDDDANSHLGKGFEKKPREASFFHKSDKKPVKLATNRFEGLKRKWPNEIEEIVHKIKEAKVDTQLHPSWQAKQKLKPTITEFKGTKITFD
ncbi:uncharacterized protein LOC116350791 [Contarinia nasturtii]|uniref:uncharacterized protein LOC116350791 n=1 Tax=Contarinia nasturtii TaxID=265458 RepID=UPI0012D4BB87|nr:uncharacterized protein LOC116350791 [Contarinia nasturtii]